MLKSGDVIPADVLIVGIGERKKIFHDHIDVFITFFFSFPLLLSLPTNTVKCLMMNL